MGLKLWDIGVEREALEVECDSGAHGDKVRRAGLNAVRIRTISGLPWLPAGLSDAMRKERGSATNSRTLGWSSSDRAARRRAGAATTLAPAMLSDVSEPIS